MKKYVITGVANSGKTTLIKMLANKGYVIIPEAADEIIREENNKENKGLIGSGDVFLFQQSVAERQLELERKTIGEMIFLDRGIVDSYAYCKYFNVTIPQIIIDHARGRYEKIFLLDPLGIYEYDGVRTASLEEAQKMQLFIEEAYIFFDYMPICVPVMKQKERMEFILNLL